MISLSHGFAVTLPNLPVSVRTPGLLMTKRKHAANTATTVTSSARGPKASSPNLLHPDSSANPSAEKKAKISEACKSAASEHISGEDLDIDDIFQQARKKKQAPVIPEKVFPLPFSEHTLALLGCWQCLHLLQFLSYAEAQGSQQST